MIVVFAGPSLDVSAARTILDADYRPPVANRDVVTAVRDGATAIGIIDGVFEWTLAVWHKEILWALADGVPVLGAASMGALRAVELEPFGMRGVGRIYELYRDGVLDDDDEVAVVHAPGDGYAPASEAMVDIRLTLDAARAAGVISDRTRRWLIRAAKRSFYPDRAYDSLLRAARSSPLPQAELTKLEQWLPAGRVDQKRTDALALIRELATLDAGGLDRVTPSFVLARSSFLERLLERS